MLERRSLAVLFSLLGLTLGSSVSAQVAQPVRWSGINLFMPSLNSRMEYNITALALRPSATNLNYAILNNELPAQSPNWYERELRPSYTAAFEVGVRYFMNSSCNDIHLTWTHLNSSTSDNITADGVNYFIGPDYEIGPDATDIRAAAGHATFKYDVINLDVGQNLYFCNNVRFHFFGGLSTGFLRQDVQTTFSGTVLSGIFAGPFSTTSDNYSNFTGIGPRFGAEMSYQIGNGFGLMGEAAVSALIGSSHSVLNFTSSAVELATLYAQDLNYQAIKDQNNIQVVPGIDTKLGVNYKYCFCHQALLTMEAGYQAAVYINAINQYMPGSLVTGAPLDTGGIFVATMNHTLSNYSVQGPFLGFSLKL